MTSPPLTVMERMRAWARRMKLEVMAVWIAAQDPRTPRWVRWLALAVVAYALSPIDLIPDFIPVLGLLDDIVLVPLGLMLVMRWLPEGVHSEARVKAQERLAAGSRLPANRTAARVIVALWVVVFVALAFAAYAWRDALGQTWGWFTARGS